MGEKRDLDGTFLQSISTSLESGDGTAALTLCANQTWLFVDEGEQVTSYRI